MPDQTVIFSAAYKNFLNSQQNNIIAVLIYNIIFAH